MTSFRRLGDPSAVVPRAGPATDQRSPEGPWADALHGRYSDNQTLVKCDITQGW
jgi:hypothetical protein